MSFLFFKKMFNGSCHLLSLGTKLSFHHLPFLSSTSPHHDTHTHTHTFRLNKNAQCPHKTPNSIFDSGFLLPRWNTFPLSSCLSLSPNSPSPPKKKKPKISLSSEFPQQFILFPFFLIVLVCYKPWLFIYAFQMLKHMCVFMPLVWSGY